MERTKMKFTDTQEKRNVEVQIAAYAFAKALTENENLEWNMEYIEAIADISSDILYRLGYEPHYPAHKNVARTGFDNSRNREIYQLYMNNVRIKEIANRFGLSVARIHQICQKMERVIEYETQSHDAVETTVGATEYIVNKYKDRFSQALLVRASGCVQKIAPAHGYLHTNSDYREFLKVLKKLSVEDCIKISNCGERTTNVLMAIKKAEGL